MRKDHLTYITSKILNLLNNIKIKKNEVIEFGLMEQRQGKHLINLTLELIDYCSQFVEEKEHITNITTNVYRVWKDLKNVRKNAGIICKCIEKKNNFLFFKTILTFYFLFLVFFLVLTTQLNPQQLLLHHCMSKNVKEIKKKLLSLHDWMK